MTENNFEGSETEREREGGAGRVFRPKCQQNGGEALLMGKE